MSVLELIQVTKTYGSDRDRFVALQPTSLTLREGEVLLISGPSGSGKTTLLSIMGCILKPSSGRVIVKGIDITKRGEHRLPAVRAKYFGFIFQQYHLFAALTALENIEMVLRMKFGRYPNAGQEAERLLTLVGLGHRLHTKPSALSGGERQRVAIARALSGDAVVILADEPTAALDSKNAILTVELLCKLAEEERRTIVLISHDRRLEAYADRTIRMQDGAIVESSQSPFPSPTLNQCEIETLSTPTRRDSQLVTCKEN